MTTRFRLKAILDARADTVGAMSQRQLAFRSGVSATTVNAMYRNATAQVSLATLDAISKALDVEPGELLERDGKKRR
jgi:DNA-binding Xre family transcriptional regulator